MKQELEVYAGYKEYKAALDTELAKTAEGFVRIGYLLRVAADTDILKDSGYKNVLEFAQKEYGLDKSQVSRFIAINERFSENGYSDRLNVNYQGFGYAKLSIMLQLPDAVNKILTPDFSKAEIQEVKKEVDKEKEISDLELLTEDVIVDMGSMSLLEQVVYQTGRESPELFLKLYQAEEMDPHTCQEILAPSGEGLITVRIPGTGRLMLSVKDVDRDITLVNVRSGEKENFTWEELTTVIGKLTGRLCSDRLEDGKKWWEQVYKETWPVPEEPESSQVPSKQEPPKPRKETKVVPAKPEPPKAPKRPAPPKKTEPRAAAPEKEESVPKEPESAPKEPESGPKEPESAQETPQNAPRIPEVAPVQQEAQEESGVEGQISIEKDFPEYLPDDYMVAEGGIEVLPVKYAGLRYEVKSVVSDYGLYDNGQLALLCFSRRNALLIKAIMEKEQRVGSMGDYYFRMEDCEKFFKESEDMDDRTVISEAGPEEET